MELLLEAQVAANAVKNLLPLMEAESLSLFCCVMYLNASVRLRDDCEAYSATLLLLPFCTVAVRYTVFG